MGARRPGPAPLMGGGTKSLASHDGWCEPGFIGRSLRGGASDTPGTQVFLIPASPCHPSQNWRDPWRLGFLCSEWPGLWRLGPDSAVLQAAPATRLVPAIFLLLHQDLQPPPRSHTMCSAEGNCALFGKEQVLVYDPHVEYNWTRYVSKYFLLGSFA